MMMTGCSRKTAVACVKSLAKSSPVKTTFTAEEFGRTVDIKDSRRREKEDARWEKEDARWEEDGI
jgi:hypothetical protein